MRTSRHDPGPGSRAARGEATPHGLRNSQGMFAGRHHAKVAPVDLFTGLRVREKAIVRIIPGFESRTRRATLTTAERFGTREHLRIANNHHFPTPHIATPPASNFCAAKCKER